MVEKDRFAAADTMVPVWMGHKFAGYISDLLYNLQIVIIVVLRMGL
jgi:hypothetical protein